MYAEYSNLHLVLQGRKKASKRNNAANVILLLDSESEISVLVPL